jgi:TPP-dependent 2-oxoacid decarboxylase
MTIRERLDALRKALDDVLNAPGEFNLELLDACEKVQYELDLELKELE